MDFSVLGPQEVRADGRVLGLGWPKQRAVLAALLLTPNRVVPVSALIDAVWNERPPESATTGVQKYVSGLRQLLGVERLATRRPGYLIAVEEGELDLLQFDSLVQAARVSAEGDDVAAAVDFWRRALGLWRGDPAEDVELGGQWRPVLAR